MLLDSNYSILKKLYINIIRSSIKVYNFKVKQTSTGSLQWTEAIKTNLILTNKLEKVLNKRKKWFIYRLLMRIIIIIIIICLVESKSKKYGIKSKTRSQIIYYIHIINKILNTNEK